MRSACCCGPRYSSPRSCRSRYFSSFSFRPSLLPPLLAGFYQPADVVASLISSRTVRHSPIEVATISTPPPSPPLLLAFLSGFYQPADVVASLISWRTVRHSPRSCSSSNSSSSVSSYTCSFRGGGGLCGNAVCRLRTVHRGPRGAERQRSPVARRLSAVLPVSTAAH